MKRIATLLLLIAPLFSLHAQKHVYEDLLVLFVDEQYEKCLVKAENYTLKEATKKDALPFLYISMCLYEMSKLEKFSDDYPKAAVEALKYAVKYRKKDKDNEFFASYEDYWADLNTMAMEMGEVYLDDERGASKARMTFRYMTQYYPENPGAWLMLALSEYSKNMKREGDESIKGFEEAYNGVPDLNRLPPDQKKLLRTGLIRMSEYLMEKGERSAAREMINRGKDVFMDSPDFKLQYDDLN
jgi:hypothetical protein